MKVYAHQMNTTSKELLMSLKTTLEFIWNNIYTHTSSSMRIPVCMRFNITFLPLIFNRKGCVCLVLKDIYDFIATNFLQLNLKEDCKSNSLGSHIHINHVNIRLCGRVDFYMWIIYGKLWSGEGIIFIPACTHTHWCLSVISYLITVIISWKYQMKDIMREREQSLTVKWNIYKGVQL